MNIFRILVFAITATVWCAAQEHDLETRNRFYIGGRLHFNVTGTMRSLPVAPNIGPFYDDGFVADDSSGSAGGKSWNWGYNVTNQIIGTSPNRQLELHGAPSPRDNTSDKLDADTQYGFEIGYGREFWRFGKPERPIRVGFEASFSASALLLEAQNTISGTVMRVNDRYLLGSVIPPNAPYSGSFQGGVPPNPPSPLIGTNIISSTTTAETATSTQASRIEGTYWGFRLGPFIEAPLPGRFSLQASVGMSLVQVDATLSYEEVFTITGIGGPPPTRRDSHSQADWLFGFYTNARVNWWVNDVVAIYLGGEFQALDDFHLTAADKDATLDFGSAFGLVAGVMYAF